MAVRSLMALVFVWQLAQPSFAVVTSDEAGSHTTTPGKPSFGTDIDGVAVVTALSGGTQFEELVPLCSGALITDRHVLTAAHCVDSDGDQAVDDLFTFFPPRIAFESRTGPVILPFEAFAAQFPPEWSETPTAPADLAVLELEENAPVELARYPLYGLTDEVNKPAVIVGYGRTGHGSTGENPIIDIGPVKRAGRNRYEVIFEDTQLLYDFDSGSEENNALGLVGLDSDLGFGPDEVCSATGDSGGPVFVHGAIAGVSAQGSHTMSEADVNHVVDASWGEVGLDTRVSAFRSFITDATGGEAVFLDLLGDFDFNEELDATDIDTLADRIRTGQLDAFYDLDLSGSLDADDHRLWVKVLKRTWYGDADLDGEFNSSDLLVVVQAGEYEDDLPMNSGWETGDWNGDAEFGTGDFVLAFQDGGYERGPLSAAIAIPEPASLVMLVTGLAMITAYSCRC